MMNIGVVGSRTWTDRKLLDFTLTTNFDVSDTLITGYDTLTRLPKGADELAYLWSVDSHVDHILFPPKEKERPQKGNRIYAERNQKIVDASDRIIAFVVPDVCLCTSPNKPYGYKEKGVCDYCGGRGWLASRGTAITLNMAKKKGIPILIALPDGTQVTDW